VGCRVCHSLALGEFPAEINIHAPGGLENLNKPCVVAFPKLVVCYDCGFSEFQLDGIERNELRDYRTDSKLIVSICAACKRIRREGGTWASFDEHATYPAGVLFSHGICPACAARVYPDINLEP
jgi:hypothetical protein